MYEIDPKLPTHGSSGPLKASHGRLGEVLQICQEFSDIGPKFEKNRPTGEEGNGLDAASLNVFYVSSLNSRVVEAAPTHTVAVSCRGRPSGYQATGSARTLL